MNMALNALKMGCCNASKTLVNSYVLMNLSRPEKGLVMHNGHRGGRLAFLRVVTTNIYLNFGNDKNV